MGEAAVGEGAFNSTMSESVANDALKTNGNEDLNGTEERGVQVDESREEAAGDAQELSAATDGERVQKVTRVCGIDLGSLTSVVASCSLETFRTDIARNDMSNQETSMIVSFAAGHRSFGEEAAQLQPTNASHTFDSLLRRIDFCRRDPAEEKEPMDWIVEPSAVETIELDTLMFPSQKFSFHCEELLGYLLKQLERFGRNGSEAGSPVCIVLPELFNSHQVQAIRDAALLANVDLRVLITTTEAAAIEYGSKRSCEILDGSAFFCIDVGHTYTSAAVYVWKEKRAERVAVDCVEGLGGGAIDRAIFREVCSDLLAKKGYEVVPGSKFSIRLLNQVRKLKETLSAVTESRLQLDLPDDLGEISLVFSRERLESCCKRISQLMTEFVAGLIGQLKDSPILDDIKACELIGGGMRVPFVKEAILNGINNENVALRYTMDSMAAIAVGASLRCSLLYRPDSGVVQRPFFDTIPVLKINDSRGDCMTVSRSPMSPNEREVTGVLSVADLKNAVARENLMRTADDDFVRLCEIKNKLESKIFEARTLADKRDAHSNLINKEDCISAANGIEEWFLDWDEGGGSNAKTPLESYSKKLEELEKAIELACGAYFEKISEDKLKHEQEMEEAAKIEAAKKALNGDDQEDHDRRRLPKADRLRKVEINKKEAGELLKDGNTHAALQRYLRALQHCDKLDLAPDLVEEDKETKKDLLVSIQLNVTHVYLKLSKFEEAVTCATKVLKLTPNSPKALYRLAYAHENLRNFETAKKHLLLAQTHAPEDSAVEKLLMRVNAQIRREKQKQKKMAQKMFG